MRTAIYARVSTSGNRCLECNKTFVGDFDACPRCNSPLIERSQETENQLRQLRDWCQREGHTIVKEYIDRASGTKGSRTAFAKFLYDAQQHKFDLVIFWALDRLSREGALRTLQYLETLTQSGVAWRSHTEPYLDSLGPFRDAIISILAVVAKQERNRISERTRAGLDRKRAEHFRKTGKKLHLGPPFLKINREQVLESYARTRSMRRTAQEFGISKDTIHRRIRRLS